MKDTCLQCQPQDPSLIFVYSGNNIAGTFQCILHSFVQVRPHAVRLPHLQHSRLANLNLTPPFSHPSFLFSVEYASTQLFILRSYMDPHVWESALNRLSCTDKTHVLHLDSREAANDNILDEKQLLSKLSEFVRLFHRFDTAESSPNSLADQYRGGPPACTIYPNVSMNALNHGGSLTDWRRTAKGDPIYDPNPLEISKNVLRSLVTSGLFLPQTITVFKETQSHFSHRIEYDMQSETPSAIRK